MIFSTIFALAALLLSHVVHALPHAEPSTRSTTVRATFDNTFDNPSGSLSGVACSNGPNGLLTRFPRFSTFDTLPLFPFIGGAPGIGWNSPNCGGCWRLTNPATRTSIIMTAIDQAATFNMAEEAFVTLNGGQVGQGTLDVVAEQVPSSLCGL